MNSNFKHGDYVSLNTIKKYAIKTNMEFNDALRFIGVIFNDGEVDSRRMLIEGGETCVGVLGGTIGTWFPDLTLTNGLTVEQLIRQNRGEDLHLIDFEGDLTVEQLLEPMKEFAGHDFCNGFDTCVKEINKAIETIKKPKMKPSDYKELLEKMKEAMDGEKIQYHAEFKKPKTLNELSEIPHAFDKGKYYKCVKGIGNSNYIKGKVYETNGEGILDEWSNNFNNSYCSAGGVSKFIEVDGL